MQKDEKDIDYTLRLLWCILCFNVMSIVQHLYMVHHVGSTGPEDILPNHRPNKNRMMAYAAAWRYSHFWPPAPESSHQDPFVVLKRILANIQNNHRLSSSSSSSNRQLFQEDFLKDLQHRLITARRHWTCKLDEATSRLPRPPNNPLQSYNNFLIPFRVLLHLYAYQNVIENGELDAVFNMEENGRVLTFYIPQLLSFLLYGAYLNAPQLENWILEKCETSINFAHFCFWFLRGWCLQNNFSLHNKSDDNLLSSQAMLSPKRRSRSFNEVSLLYPRNSLLGDDMDEYRMIEDLLIRVLQRGERAALKQLKHCEIKEFKVDKSPYVITPAITPKVSRLSSDELSVNSSENRELNTLFLASPKFFDSLLSIADDLFFLPRENRTFELQKKLSKLEAELLPSNMIYIPLGADNVNCCVGSIVKQECIAISTKERVPCIITLEAVNVHGSSSTHRRRYSEKEILKSWIHNQRPPQRLNSLLGKVKHYTKRNFSKLQGDVQSSYRNFMTQSVEDFSVCKKSPDDTTEQLSQSSVLSVEDLPPLNTQDEEGMEYAPLSPTSPLPHESLGQWVSPMPDKYQHNISFSPNKSKQCSISSNKSSFPFPPIPNLNDNNLLHTYSSSDEEEPSPSLQGTAPTVVFKENWKSKMSRLRSQSSFGNHAGWRLVPILIKSNDDLRQEQLASQLIRRMATILARANVPVWLYPYEILALTPRGGMMEAIPDTISLDSLKRNDPHFTTLKKFFDTHFGPIGSDCHANARANFVESLAGYSIVCYLLQLKDRHNGNILLTNVGHIIHIDFGFMFLSSPGKNSGFESAPFKLTSDFVSVMDGPESRLFARFRYLCVRTFLELRKHCYQIILMVEMITEGNEFLSGDLACFCGRPKCAISELRQRFRLDLNDDACTQFVHNLIDESLENWRIRWYDRYQRFCVGVL